MNRKIAHIHEEPTGRYHVSDASLDYLDARGPGYLTKAEALRQAAEAGYTHAQGSGTYWHGVRTIPAGLERNR